MNELQAKIAENISLYRTQKQYENSRQFLPYCIVKTDSKFKRDYINRVTKCFGLSGWHQ